jgi:hypothetical protein
MPSGWEIGSFRVLRTASRSGLAEAVATLWQRPPRRSRVFLHGCDDRDLIASGQAATARMVSIPNSCAARSRSGLLVMAGIVAPLSRVFCLRRRWLSGGRRRRGHRLGAIGAVDEHRAVGVRGAVHADRSEQDVHEFPVAAASDD